MNRRFLSVALFAVVISGFASLLIYRTVLARLSDSNKAGTAKLLVAAHNLPTGSLIRDADVRLSEWSGTVPANATAKTEDVIGRGVIADMYEGEPIVETRLAPKGGGAGLSALIPKGMRAVAVRVNEVVGLAGFVVPGMRVDILIHAVPPGGNRQTTGSETRTVLQNIEVLSAGQNIQKDVEGKPINVQVVNLLVTPEQAEVLSLASNDTKIQLVLRNPLDTEEAKTPGTALAKLFGRHAPEPIAAKSAPRPRPAPAVKAEPTPMPAPQVVVIEVIHGAKNGVKRAETKFEKSLEVHP